MYASKARERQDGRPMPDQMAQEQGLDFHSDVDSFGAAPTKRAYDFGRALARALHRVCGE
jgi:hypothetical protein